MDNAGNFNFDKGERILVSTPLSGSYYAYDNGGIEFSSVGKVDGLSGITTIPSKGWSENIAITLNSGYIIQRKYEFARLYVVSVTTNEATVKYQYPFCVDIVLKQSKYTVQKESQVINAEIVNLTSVSDISHPEWCICYFNIRNGQPYVIMSILENNTGKTRTGEILLKNNVSTAKITLTQEG
ncbi:MAG: BACON domain-containing protein [Bacteroidaceae bacterium]|nr:BACON domain-containing protein [Bacteroidaceae bacterium]